MNTAYIIDYLRTPYGKYGGELSKYRPDDLAALVLSTLLKRNEQISGFQIDDVILGCANQAGEDNRNIARLSSLIANYPIEVPGVTVNRLCASGMQSIIDATARIQSGTEDVIVAGGVESMSRAPFVMLKASKEFDRSLELIDTTLGWRFINPLFEAIYKTYSMGETAENIAEKWSLNREEQDKFAFYSHKKYETAFQKGIFENEIIPINGLTKDELTIDESFREDTNLDKLSKLRTVFRNNGTVTAGNASGLNDGAAAMIIVSDRLVNKLKLKPIAKIISSAVAGVHPDFMGTGPIPATKKLLEKTNLKIKDIDLFEINEAYAVQVIHCMNALKIDPEKVNVNGGAISIGHPLGSSGTRITGHLALELQRRNKKYGIATMCVGVGQGTAILIENINYKP